MIEMARAANYEGCSFYSGDILEMIDDLPEYDYIVSNHTLEHLPDIPKLLYKLCMHSDNLLFEVPYDGAIDSAEHIQAFSDDFMKAHQRYCKIIDRDGKGWQVLVLWIDLGGWRRALSSST